jgi:hypothetical protein
MVYEPEGLRSRERKAAPSSRQIVETSGSGEQSRFTAFRMKPGQRIGDGKV